MRTSNNSREDMQRKNRLINLAREYKRAQSSAAASQKKKAQQKEEEEEQEEEEENNEEEEENEEVEEEEEDEKKGLKNIFNYSFRSYAFLLFLLFHVITITLSRVSLVI